MLPILAAVAGVGWLVSSARSEAKASRDAASDLDCELQETFDELEDYVGQRIQVLDGDGNERSGLKGRVHKVVKSKGVIVLDVTRLNRKREPNKAQEKEFKVWRVQFDESFIELE